MDTTPKTFKPFVQPKVYLDYIHDILRRCDFCRFKYDPSELKPTGNSKVICRFCVNVEGIDNV